MWAHALYFKELDARSAKRNLLICGDAQCKIES
jgi:hypothetical protein